MKLERKNLSPSMDPSTILDELERTMTASIALMKRMRRERRRAVHSSPSEATSEQ